MVVEPVCNLPNRVPMLRKAQNLERPRHWTCIWSRSACRCNCFLLTSEMRKVKPHCHPCTGQYIHIYCNHIIYIYMYIYIYHITLGNSNKPPQICPLTTWSQEWPANLCPGHAYWPTHCSRFNQKYQLVPTQSPTLYLSLSLCWAWLLSVLQRHPLNWTLNDSDSIRRKSL